VLAVDVEVDRPQFTVRAEFAVAPGERLALFGPSGAGKTTLLEVIAGLGPARRARIELGDRVLTSTADPVIAVPPWRRRVGLLRQDPGLFPHLSVRANLRYAGCAEADLATLATALGIDALLEVMPARLSGGQAHRVALGRLLLARCDALLLDEPYTGLDASLGRSLSELVTSLIDQRGVPAILVAHELEQAQAFAHRLAVLDQGRVLQLGAPADVVGRPASRRVAELVGYQAFLPTQGGMVAGVHPDRVISGAHPERGLAVSGTVIACRPAGALWEAGVQVGETVLTGRLFDCAQPGQQLALTVVDPPLFRPDGELALSTGTSCAWPGKSEGSASNS
jgi:ABC-type sulfate/molybdate transport systems ATPase subunit